MLSGVAATGVCVPLPALPRGVTGACPSGATGAVACAGLACCRIHALIALLSVVLVLLGFVAIVYPFLAVHHDLLTCYVDLHAGTRQQPPHAGEAFHGPQIAALGAG